MFVLCVDDFGVQYIDRADALDLYNCLQKYYEEVTIDWEGKLYLGMQLHWDYKERFCDLTMDKYIPEVIKKYQHPAPKKPQHQPHPCTPIVYGPQQAQPDDNSLPLTPEAIKRIQQIVGSLVFYARAQDSTLKKALSTLGSEQTKGTEYTEEKMRQLLDYCYTHPDAKIRYYASDMMLHIHSDGSYLSEAKARSTAAGHFFLANKPNPTKPILNNGAIHTISNIIKHVMSSAAECELGTAFINAKEGVPIRTTLDEMGWIQGPTPLQVDNSTADGIANNKCKQQRSKAMDMRFYWLQDRVAQNQYHVHWEPGETNLADYYSKHHPSSHHVKVRPLYVHTKESPKWLPPAKNIVKQQPDLKGCVNPTGISDPTGITGDPTGITCPDLVLNHMGLTNTKLTNRGNNIPRYLYSSFHDRGRSNTTDAS